MCSYWGLQVTFFFVSGSYCTQSLVLLSFLNPKWYWINLCVYWLKNCSKWIILIEGLVQNWSSETSNETTLGLSIHSLPMALYNKLVGRLECHVRAPLFFVLLMNFPTDLGVLFWHAQVWVSCHRLRPQLHPHLFFHPSAFGLFVFPCSSSMLSPLLSVWRPAVWVFIRQCLFHVFLPPSFLLRRVGPLRPDAKWQLIKKKSRASPRFSPLSSRLELIPRLQSSEKGSFVVACCQSSSYSTLNISLATLMTKRLILCWFHTVITCW